MNAPRPIVIIDTSVFLADAESSGHAGAASRVLRVMPSASHVVLCDGIRQELFEKLIEDRGWTSAEILEVYGVVLEAAIWVTPVEERDEHLAFVNRDPGDTMIVRTAEAVFSDPHAVHLIAADQARFIVSHKRKHLRPGSNYAGFLVVTPHGLLEKFPK